MRKRAGLLTLFAIVCCLALAPASSAVFAQAQGAKVALSAADQRTVTDFEKRVKAYVSMREGLEGKMPKLSKDAKPEAIEAHKSALQKRVQAARAGAKQGDV